VASIDLSERGAYATKRDVDAALRKRAPTLEDPALRAFVLTNLEQVAPATRGGGGGLDGGGGGGGDDGDASSPTLRWKIHWDGIVNEMDRIAGFDVHDRAMDDGAAGTSPSSSPGGGDAEDGDDDEGIAPPPRETNDGLDINNGDANNNAVQYHGDVFFIHGGASRFVRHSHISTIASFFPNHMLTTIRGSGHWVHAEAPDDTIALLKRYLDR
jgi:pimeloyl-ACP methyl ester carboxylesterase